MNSYLVTWEIELDAENEQDAAEQAMQIMLDPDSLAKHFTVSSVPVSVDVDFR